MKLKRGTEDQMNGFQREEYRDFVLVFCFEPLDQTER